MRKKRYYIITALLWLFISFPSLATDITFTWNANPVSDNVAGYKMYYDIDAGPPYDGTESMGGADEGDTPIFIWLNGTKPLDKPNDLELLDNANPEITVTKFDLTKQWYFVVTAFDIEEHESGYSNEVVTDLFEGIYLNTNIIGSGSVTKNPDEITYTENATVIITAIPSTDWEFYEWNGDLTGNENPASIVMDVGKLIDASFIKVGSDPNMIWIATGTTDIVIPMSEEFLILEAGDYKIWGSIIAPDGSSNSFFVSIDGSADQIWDLPQPITTWTWDEANAREGTDPSIFNLNVGTHTLNIKVRENGSRINQILITNTTYNPAAQPPGPVRNIRMIEIQ